MHDVIAELCHGCAKCVEVCPTEAIVLLPVETTVASWHWPKPATASAPH